MKPEWIIEKFPRDTSCLELIEEVKRQGFPLTLVNLETFPTVKDRDGKCVILFGSIFVCRELQKLIPNAKPLAFNNARAFRCSEYYPPLAKYIFNDSHAVFEWNELTEFKWYIYEKFAKDAMVFIRPDSGDKIFTGELVDLIDFDRWVARLTPGMDPQEQIVISSPKNIRGEWRFVVTKFKEILAVSTYQYQGKFTPVPGAPQGAIDKCKEILEVGYYPDPVFCVDICEDGDGSFWLLELTSFSSAGLYECKKEPIVRRVSEIAAIIGCN